MAEVGDIHGNADVEQAVAGNEVPVGCTVWNDLRAAAELEVGQGSGWQVIYPKATLKMAWQSVDDDLQVSVRLRDDVSISGVCTAGLGSTVLLSTSFGDFGDHATKHIQNEATAAKQERLLGEQRRREINQQLNRELDQVRLWPFRLAFISLSVCLLILLGAMVACTMASFNLADELQGVGLAVVLLMLSCCAFCTFTGILVVAGPPYSTLQAWKGLMFWGCVCCVTLVFLGCVVTMSVAGDDWASAVLWGSVALMLCCGGVVISRPQADDGAGCVEKAVRVFCGALMVPVLWPLLLHKTCYKCGLLSRFRALLTPPNRSIHAALHIGHDKTIVFKGNVLPGRETVCSWPGKYATAWDTLVAGSKQNDISAAVVFLPEGSKHFGLHDRIPASKDLQDLHGECWCTPLYGESKPWGCRWWSKWIANIEQAASQECTLVVYYFNSMRGKGKVKDFTTAGEEHMRREAIELRKDAFLESQDFGIALEAGLKHLPKEKGPDSSSAYSREVHRLFLAWLPEEDCQFLVSSEGIGNSQKAEVAWLERKGYPYIEREVRELESPSPKAIGRVVTP